jgi:hypothetical protein
VAESALLGSDPESAIEFGRTAQRTSLKATACRHAVKSRLVLGVGLAAAGRGRPAARVLRAAAAGATQLDLIPLLAPSRTVLATILQVRAPGVAERERLLARTAQSISKEAAQGGSSD